MLNVALVLLAYWVILFVGCFITVEFAQNYLYDETTPASGLKVALGTLILAGALTWTRTRFDTLFTNDLGPSVLQAILWFVVFTLIFRFHPAHGFAIGVVAFLILAGTASLAIDSLMGSNPSGVPPSRRPAEPLRRRPIGPSVEDMKKQDQEKAEPAATK
jgi:hypothetical protein